MKVIFQGAESKIFVDDYLGKKMIIKQRFKKKYRNEHLDKYLIAEQMKSECRNIVRCKKAGVRTPTVYFVDWDANQIHMEYFEDSESLKARIDKLQSEDTPESKSNLDSLMERVGEHLGKMHSQSLLHGDLTTSNILLAKDEIVFIDFGLSSISTSAEDKGVDLYVLERALISTHQRADELLQLVLKGYKSKAGGSYKEVMSKFEDVRARGRKRTMVG